jgi:hypothetical protein
VIGKAASQAAAPTTVTAALPTAMTTVPSSSMRCNHSKGLLSVAIAAAIGGSNARSEIPACNCTATISVGTMAGAVRVGTAPTELSTTAAAMVAAIGRS